MHLKGWNTETSLCFWNTQVWMQRAAWEPFLFCRSFTTGHAESFILSIIIHSGTKRLKSEFERNIRQKTESESREYQICSACKPERWRWKAFILRPAGQQLHRAADTIDSNQQNPLCHWSSTSRWDERFAARAQENYFSCSAVELRPYWTVQHVLIHAVKPPARTQEVRVKRWMAACQTFMCVYAFKRFASMHRLN